MRILIATIAAFGLTLSLASAKEEAKCSKAHVTFKVDGLTCGGCENKLTKMFTAVDGVTVNKVCSKGGKASLDFDSKKVSKKQLMEVVKKSGFKLKGEEVTIPVKGMTCGGCSGKVSKALASLEGVSSQAVCHKSGKATVTFDPAKTSAKQVAATIAKSGFKVAK